MTGFTQHLYLLLYIDAFLFILEMKSVIVLVIDIKLCILLSDRLHSIGYCDSYCSDDF